MFLCNQQAFYFELNAKLFDGAMLSRLDAEGIECFLFGC